MGDVVSFSDDNLRGFQTSHDDAVIVLMMITNYDIKKNWLIVEVRPIFFFL